MKKVYCNRCRSYLPNIDVSEGCEVSRGKTTTWQSRRKKQVEVHNPSLKNANNNCEDFRKTFLGIKSVRDCMP